MSFHLRTVLAAAAAALLLVAAPPVAAAETARAVPKKSGKSKADNKPGGAAEGSVFSQATSGDKEPKKDTYTNEDLQRLFGAPPPDSTADDGRSGSVDSRSDTPSARDGQQDERADTGTDGAGSEQEREDPLAWIEKRRQAEAEQRGRIVELEKKVAAARERIGELEQTRLRVSNPYLGLAPKAPEGEADWDTLDNKKRLERTTERLEKAREDLAQAEADLAQAKNP